MLDDAPSRDAAPPSPSHSTRSARSFLDEDPYPHGKTASNYSRASYADSNHGQHYDDTSAPTHQRLLAKLESLLNDKANEIHLAGQLGSALLAQQQELEARIRELAQSHANNSPSLNDDDGAEIGLATKRKLEALEQDLKAWDNDNSALYDKVGLASQQGVPSLDSFDATTGSHAANAATARRARNNAQHRSNDIELATEIGQSLLVEVRRLQALLAEKEEHMKEMQKERDALDNALEEQNSSRRTLEETVERYKEENWNLEVASQELRTALTESQGSLNKSEAERNRATRDLAGTREALDSLKSDNEKLVNQLENLRSKHETDMATMRKHTAGLQRDKSDLASNLEALKNELATKARGIRRSTSEQLTDILGDGPRFFDEEDSDHDDEYDMLRRDMHARRRTGDGFPPDSPGELFSDDEDANVEQPTAVRYGSSTQLDDTLKSSLAHAQRTIATLRSSLAREKAAKMELRRQLVDNGVHGTWEDDSESGASSRENTPVRSVRSPALRGSVRGSARGRASARRRGGGAIGVPSRLGRQVGGGDTSIESIDEEDIESPTGGQGDALFDHSFNASDNSMHDSPTQRFDVSSKRNSMASVRSFEMDPAFAQADDNASTRSGMSVSSAAPHHRATLAEMLPSGRPLSLMSIGRDNSLSGFDMREVAETEEESEAKIKVPVFVDACVMTDFPPVCLETPRPLCADKAVQITPEPILTPTMIDFALQTIADEPVALVDVEMQTEAEDVPEPIPVPVEAIAPPVELMHVAVQVTPKPEPAVQVVEFGLKTEEPAKLVTRDAATDAEPIKHEAGQNLTAEAQAQSSPIRAALYTGAMEDRALRNELSLSTISLGQLSPLTDARDDTLLPGSVNRRSRVPAESDLDTETETEGEFEDARESLRAATPSVTHGRSTSFNDFASVRSRMTSSNVEDSESDLEVLRGSKRSPHNRKRRSLPRSGSDGETPRKRSPVTMEVSVQTDEWRPEPIIVHVPVHVPASGTASAPAAVVAPEPQPVAAHATKTIVRNIKRESINTFGRSISPDGDLGEAAATASAWLGTTNTGELRPMSPEDSVRPDSVLSLYSEASRAISDAPAGVPLTQSKPDLAIVTKMGPPPTPSRKQTKPAVAPRKSAASMLSTRSLQAPPRPLSPPPADLLHRAQSPIFDEDYRSRQSGSTFLTPSAAVNKTRSGGMAPPSSTTSRTTSRDRRGRSSTSGYLSDNYTLHSVTKGKSDMTPRLSRANASSRASLSDASVRSDVSRRYSIASSRTSEGGFDGSSVHMRTQSATADSTDPQIIHAITQTMIGEFMHKYTRRSLGKGISEKRHKRFFWIHPYTKTLYWSSTDPGSQSVHQTSSKSVLIDGVSQVLDPNPFPPGLHQSSIIIHTPNRELKITAATRERHDMWFNAINYLLTRPEGTLPSAPSASPRTQRSRTSAPMADGNAPTSPFAFMSTLTSKSDSRLTPRPSRGSRLSFGGANLTGTATRKRAGTAAEAFENMNQFGSPRSIRTYSSQALAGAASGTESIEVVDRSEIPSDYDHLTDDGYEGLENVRACCGGSHDVGSLSRKSHSHSVRAHRRKSRGVYSDNESLSTPLQTPSNRSKTKINLFEFGSGGGGGLAVPTSSVSSSTVKRSKFSSKKSAGSDTGMSETPGSNSAPPFTPLAVNSGLFGRRRQ
ncbi:hypothetical protein ACM66B_003775 [Microbotryomycetes sp. NB124-2]